MSGVSVETDTKNLGDFVPFEIATREPGRFVVIKFTPDEGDRDWGIASIDTWDNPIDGKPVLNLIADGERMQFDGAYARARAHADRIGAKGIAVYMIEETA
jgi:hypothetical protein